MSMPKIQRMLWVYFWCFFVILGLLRLEFELRTKEDKKLEDEIAALQAKEAPLVKINQNFLYRNEIMPACLKGRR